MSIHASSASILSKLSHDLMNEFVIIRASAGNIRKHSSEPEFIEKKIETINKALDQAIKHLEITKALISA